MSAFVVDASVAVKWFVPEDHAERAAGLIAPGLTLSAPELIAAELGNVAWKKHRRGELSSDEALGMLTGFARIEILLRPIAPLVRAAFLIARETRRSLYDCLYLALAEREDSRLVTADRRFHDAVVTGPFRRRMLWIEELP